VVAQAIGCVAKAPHPLPRAGLNSNPAFGEMGRLR
jgi:hypothetical protein